MVAVVFLVAGSIVEARITVTLTGATDADTVKTSQGSSPHVKMTAVNH
jgi:hypothetical protein